VIPVEQAGGLSLTGKTRIMDLHPQKVHPTPHTLHPHPYNLHPEPFRVEVSDLDPKFQTLTPGPPNPKS